MTRHVRYVALLAAAAMAAALLPAVTSASAQPRRPGVYRNALAPRIPGGGTIDSCADPTVIRGRGVDARRWFMYCTTDPLNDGDTRGRAADDITFHPVPMSTSRDLVHWRYVGDALPQRPSWAAPTAAMWAPDVVYSRIYHRYYLSFVVTDTADRISGEPGCTSDSAIGVATSRRPTGPWTVSNRPLVAPRRHGTGCDFYWTYDPDVLGESVARTSILYYGSYFGGILAQRVRLRPSGMSLTGAPTRVTRGAQRRPALDPAQQQRAAVSGRAAAAAAAARQVTIPNRYEGANVVKRGRWFYLFASATNCCNGPLTGYSVFVGRSASRFGPFRDREGNSMLAGRVGGTPVLTMNGNRWVGTGHNTVFRDAGGQWWTVFHAVDRFDPYFAGQPTFTKRPALLDPVDWVRGWPTVRSGRGASVATMPAPAAQRGQHSAYRPRAMPRDHSGRLLPNYSDEFRGSALADRWSFTGTPPAPTTYGVQAGRLDWQTQAGDIAREVNTASVLTEAAPHRDYVVETKVRVDVPDDGSLHNYVQGGLVVYGNDDAFVKLATVSIFETRQTEFAKEVPTGTRYGNTVVGAPGAVTWLRLVKRTVGGRVLFTASTSQDGHRWVRGGTWVHNGLRTGDRIGLVSMGGVGFTSSFDYVRVHALRP